MSAPLHLRCLTARLLLIALLACTSAVAQVTPITTGDEPELVDQAVGDAGPLATSLRVVETGLAQPGDFQRVYRLPATEMYMRVQGGLYAVFPRSRYTQSRQGMLASIPADTQFFIGPPDLSDPADLADEERAPRHSASQRMDLRLAAPLINGSERRIEPRRSTQITGVANEADEAAPLPIGNSAALLRQLPPLQHPGRRWNLVGAEAIIHSEDVTEAPSPQAMSVTHRGFILDADLDDATAVQRSIGNDPRYRAIHLRSIIRRAAGFDDERVADQAARGPSSSPSSK